MFFDEYSNKRIQKWRTFRYLASVNPLLYKVKIEDDFDKRILPNNKYQKCGVLYQWVDEERAYSCQGNIVSYGVTGWSYIDKTSNVGG